jgi:hypothetical protein
MRMGMHGVRHHFDWQHDTEKPYTPPCKLPRESNRSASSGAAPQRDFPPVTKVQSHQVDRNGCEMGPM